MAATVPIEFGHWFAGFIDGEGSFGIRQGGNWNGYACYFTIFLRADDLPILEEIQRVTGLGLINQHKGPIKSKPVVRWLVYSKADCQGLVEILDAFPLRAKKRRDYLIWREAVAQWCNVDGRRRGGRGPARDWKSIATLAAQLRLVRVFTED